MSVSLSVSCTNEISVSKGSTSDATSILFVRQSVRYVRYLVRYRVEFFYDTVVYANFAVNMPYLTSRLV